MQDRCDGFDSHPVHSTTRAHGPTVRHRPGVAAIPVRLWVGPLDELRGSDDMTGSKQPLTLRLPFAMVDRHLRLEQILAADPSRSWAKSLPLLAVFALTRPEKRFACRLMQRKRNIWLFRCNQRGFCGDFIAVDMSADLLRLRSVGERPDTGTCRQA